MLADWVWSRRMCGRAVRQPWRSGLGASVPELWAVCGLDPGATASGSSGPELSAESPGGVAEILGAPPPLAIPRRTLAGGMTRTAFALRSATRIDGTGESTALDPGGDSLPGVRRACSLASFDHLQQDLARHREGVNA